MAQQLVIACFDSENLAHRLADLKHRWPTNSKRDTTAPEAFSLTSQSGPRRTHFVALTCDGYKHAQDYGLLIMRDGCTNLRRAYIPTMSLTYAKEGSFTNVRTK